MTKHERPATTPTGGDDQRQRGLPSILRWLVLAVVGIPIGCGTIAAVTAIGFVLAVIVSGSGSEAFGGIVIASFWLGVIAAIAVIVLIVRRPPKRFRRFLPDKDDRAPWWATWFSWF